MIFTYKEKKICINGVDFYNGNLIVTTAAKYKKDTINAINEMIDLEKDKKINKLIGYYNGKPVYRL